MAGSRWLAALSAVTTLMAAPAFCADVVPAGPEFQVSRGQGNYYTYDGYAYRPDATRLPNGDFVVVWEELVQNYVNDDYAYGFRVAGKRFAQNGSGKGQQFKIFQQSDEVANNMRFIPNVAGTPDDGFIVVWGNAYDNEPSETFGRIWAQRFDQNNDPVAPKFQVNVAEADVRYDARRDVASDPDGGFLVVWESWVYAAPDGASIMARKFDASDNPLGPEFQVNTQDVGRYGYPAVSANEQGDFVVVWSASNFGVPGQAPDGVFAQRLDEDGTPAGAEIPVALHETAGPWRNSVGVGPDGSFMAVMWDYQTGGPPGTGMSGRVFDAAGDPVGDEFAIGQPGGSDYGSVAADPDGNFIVAWFRHGQTDLFAQRFGPSGAPLGPEFKVNDQEQSVVWEFPTISADQYGDFVVAWARNYWYPDYYASIRARRFAVCGNGRVGPDDACDDGNTTALDGCSDTCKVETCHTCSGDPSVCPQLPGCTAVCTNPAAIQPNTAGLSFKGLGAPVGDEGFAFKGKVLNPPLAHLEYDPSADGIELAFTTNALVYGMFGSTAIPPGAPGSGCDPARDGWKVKPGSYVYKNASNALPPTCTPGSANGVRVVKVKDKIDRDGTLQFRVKARNASIANVPTPPLVATVVLGTSPGAGAAGRCGQITFTGVLGSRFFP